jgi:exosome complex exonuclease DIS3/RRP44
MKIVREHYLRDDITCGSEVCKKCDRLQNERPLQICPESRNILLTQAHYLLPDSNVVLHQVS